MHVAIPEPFDFERTLERIAVLGPDRVNALDDGGLVRAISGAAVAARPVEGGVSIDSESDEAACVFRHAFGAHLDVAGFVDEFAEHPALGPLIRSRRGLRPFLVPDPYEMIVSAITAQQISLHAALAVRNRFVERFGVATGPVYAFPTPERVASASVDELRELGFSRSKARFALEIARAEVDFAELGSLSDNDAVECLSELPGVGRWTAEWFLARHLGREDVWPAGDLGVRRACERFLAGGDAVDEARARALGAQFAPRRTLACTYLLAGLRSA